MTDFEARAVWLLPQKRRHESLHTQDCFCDGKFSVGKLLFVIVRMLQRKAVSIDPCCDMHWPACLTAQKR